MARRLGDILIEKGFLSESQLEGALRSQGPKHGMLGSILVSRGHITLNQLGEALALQFEVPFQTIVPESVVPQIARLIPEAFSRERCVIPVALDQGRLKLAMSAPDDIETIAEAELITGYPMHPLVALEREIQAGLDRAFDDRLVAQQTIVDMKLTDLTEAREQGEPEAVNGGEEEEAAPVVRLVRAILLGAINAGASDIHLEPFSPEMRVRYRVDGQLQQVMTIPEHIEEAVAARIKVMADMDTTENRRPQDGHLTVDEDGTRVNFRASTIPTVDGEKVVLRLLDEGNRVFELERLGMTRRDVDLIQALIDKPHGMLVVTGPTGSGKSTTMYAMLSRLNKVERNIVTVEDPIEYRLPGINQVQSDNDFGLGFANALKYIMRQDPDVIMVGEIRDHETATTAVQAALTGHLLISTLHTNDAMGSVARLQNLGVDAFKVGGALLGSVAQRLLRCICEECKEPHRPSDKLLSALCPVEAAGEGEFTFYQGRGCRKCLGTGYQGRLPIFEVMTVTPRVAKAIEQGLPPTQLLEAAALDGMVELRHAGWEQALAGKTTLEEVFYKTSG